MKLYKVPETLIPKIPLGKIIKYIKKDDDTLTPKTGIILKQNDGNIVLKGLGGPSIWSIKCTDNVCYVTKDILDSIKPKKVKNKIKGTKKKTKTKN